MAYIDPLSFKDKSYKRGKQSDIFSFGVILWEISSGKIPCEGATTNYEVFLHRLNGSRDLPFHGTSEQYIDLYSKCWDEEPNRRPSSETVNRLLKLLITSPSTYTLDLSECQIGNTEATVLAKALESNFSLSSLNLVYNEITHTRAKFYLKKALDSNSSLTSLNLQHNQIGAAGATALAKALESNSSLTSLNLYGNQIGGTGATALAKALESNSSLTSLNLQHNQIGGTGATSLAKALESNSSLTSLNLEYNQIGGTGATALA